MEIETLNTMSGGMYLSLMMIKVIAVIFILFAIIGFGIYIAGIAWLCFEEKRRSLSATRRPRRASPPNSSKPLVLNTQVGTIFSTSRALWCEASPAAPPRF